jgi:hypothetical protein
MRTRHADGYRRETGTAPEDLLRELLVIRIAPAWLRFCAEDRAKRRLDCRGERQSASPLISCRDDRSPDVDAEERQLEAIPKGV